MSGTRSLPGHCVNHPDRPAVAGCRHCGDFLCAECAAAGEDRICAVCAGVGSDNPAALWERGRNANGFFKTIWGVIRGPEKFFGKMPHGRGAWYAYLYAGIALLFSTLLTTGVTWLFAGGPEGAPFPWYVALNAPGLAGLLLLDAVALFGLGRLYQSRLAFRDVLRVASYGATAYLVLFIPVFGPLLVLALILVYLTLGAHRGLHFGVAQSLSLALLPVVIRLGAAWIIYGDRFWELVGG
ncbi:MAG: hypothetical protein NTW26_04745 [bacterium]|nr:hypothetical protein [bacterium]